MAKEKVKDHSGKDNPYYWAWAYPTQKERLAWVIEFIQEDLNVLEPSGVFDLYIQMEKHVYMRKLVSSHEVNPQIILDRTPVDISKLFDSQYFREMPDIQEKVKEFFFEKIWPMIEHGKKNYPLIEEYKKSPKEERDPHNLLDLLIDIDEVNKYLSQGKDPTWESFKRLLTFDRYAVTSIITVNYDKKTLSVDDQVLEGRNIKAVYEFKNLIRNLSLDAIRQCDECKRFFYNPTKKKKAFCRTQCGWRYNARKRRENDPEAYREKQKKVMWERYEDQVRKKLGKNVTIRRRKNYKIKNKKKKDEIETTEK
jgi:hypothetical protein